MPHDPTSVEAGDARIDDSPPSRPPARPVAFAVLVVVLAAGVVLRFVARSDLWLDEALSVNIAALPVGDLLDALRRDGHPPLYYLLLHGWSGVFGTGDLAVRSLSGTFAVAALPAAWWAGRRYAGRSAAVAMVVLLASSPFAVRYANEARMYSLVVLLVLLGWLALQRAREEPRPGRLALVALAGGALALTHYWSFYLLAAVGGLLVLQAVRAGPGAERRVAVRLVVAVGASAVVFLPWLPSFLAQLGSTGTPWGAPARPAVVVWLLLRDYGGGLLGESDLLGLAIAVLVLLAVCASAGTDGDQRLVLDLRTTRHARPELAVVVLTLVVATLASYATNSAYETRYTAVVLPLVLLLAAYGVTRLPLPVVGGAVVAAMALTGLALSVRTVVVQRTQAREVAAAIVDRADPSTDVVAYCPDQLGVAVSRQLPAELRGVTFPDAARPEFVDWVDYQERTDAADVAAFAADVSARAADDGALWLVWFGGYRTHDGICERLIDELTTLRPQREAVVVASEVFEPAELLRFGSVG